MSKRSGSFRPLVPGGIGVALWELTSSDDTVYATWELTDYPDASASWQGWVWESINGSPWTRVEVFSDVPANLPWEALPGGAWNAGDVEIGDDYAAYGEVRDGRGELIARTPVFHVTVA